MKIFIDESGQTGCCKTNFKKHLSFNNQPLFSLGCVLAKNMQEENFLIEKYNNLKNLFNIKSEIKGSDLCTKEHNEASIFLLIIS